MALQYCFMKIIACNTLNRHLVAKDQRFLRGYAHLVTKIYAFTAQILLGLSPLHNRVAITRFLTIAEYCGVKIRQGQEDQVCLNPYHYADSVETDRGTA